MPNTPRNVKFLMSSKRLSFGWSSRSLASGGGQVSKSQYAKPMVRKDWSAYSLMASKNTRLLSLVMGTAMVGPVASLITRMHIANRISGAPLIYKKKVSFDSLMTVTMHFLLESKGI